MWEIQLICGNVEILAITELTVLSQICDTGRASKIGFLMLVSCIMVISRLKNTQWRIYGILIWECIEEKGHILYIRNRAILIATGANLLDTKYEFQGFNGDQETPLTNEYHCHKTDFIGTNTGFVVMCKDSQ